MREDFKKLAELLCDTFNASQALSGWISDAFSVQQIQLGFCHFRILTTHNKN